MIKVLIANDDKNILKKVIEVVKNIDDTCILQTESYQQTFKMLYENKDIDKIILDITMPTYEIKKHDNGGTYRRSAGIDILYKMKVYNFTTPVLLLTRLEQFYDSNDSKKNDFKSIERDILNQKWDFCRKIVKFEDELDLDWKRKIETFIKEDNEKS